MTAWAIASLCAGKPAALTEMHAAIVRLSNLADSEDSACAVAMAMSCCSDPSVPPKRRRLGSVTERAARARLLASGVAEIVGAEGRPDVRGSLLRVWRDALAMQLGTAAQGTPLRGALIGDSGAVLNAAASVVAGEYMPIKVGRESGASRPVPLLKRALRRSAPSSFEYYLLSGGADLASVHFAVCCVPAAAVADAAEPPPHVRAVQETLCNDPEPLPVVLVITCVERWAGANGRDAEVLLDPDGPLAPLLTKTAQWGFPGALTTAVGWLENGEFHYNAADDPRVVVLRQLLLLTARIGGLHRSRGRSGNAPAESSSP
jgi:hypothetical protein